MHHFLKTDKTAITDKLITAYTVLQLFKMFHSCVMRIFALHTDCS